MANPTVQRGRVRAQKEVPSRTTPDADHWEHLADPVARVIADIARRSGFDQALLLDPEDRLVEAATANLFLVIDGGLVTAPLEAGPLPGITREAVLDCAREQGIAVEERPVPLAALRDASEGFLTNSVAGVQPLAEVRVGPDSWRAEAPGPTTESLASEYDALVLRECRQNSPDGPQHES